MTVVQQDLQPFASAVGHGRTKSMTHSTRQQQSETVILFDAGIRRSAIITSFSSLQSQ